MQLVDVLKENMIFLNFEATNKEEAIDKFINSLDRTGTIKEPNALKDALLEREKLGTTGIGQGIAMPHARSSAIKDLTVAFFRSEKGIDFKSMDSEPVHLVFLLLAPVTAELAILVVVMIELANFPLEILKSTILLPSKVTLLFIFELVTHPSFNSLVSMELLETVT